MLDSLLAKLEKGRTPTLLLALLTDGEMYGYQMAEALARSRGGLLSISAGNLYPTLHRLEADGLVEAHWKAGPWPRPRRYYRLTSKGRSEAERSAADLGELAKVTPRVVPEAG